MNIIRFNDYEWNIIIYVYIVEILWRSENSDNIKGDQINMGIVSDPLCAGHLIEWSRE